MPGTKEGGIKARETILRKNPNHYVQIGIKGGSAKVPKGFALMDGKKHAESSAKGGRSPKRKKKQ